MSFVNPVCPAGFDCIHASSCPNMILDCPPGYFCSSYQGSPHQNLIDTKYAQRVSGDSGLSEADAHWYVEQGRYVQTACFSGFQCPTGTEIASCSEGHWCPDSTEVQKKCDGLSMCPEFSAIQVNFIDALITAILTAIVVFISCRAVSTQQRKQKESRKLKPTEQAVGDSRESIEVSQNGIQIDFRDVVLHKYGHLVIPGISGVVPPSKVSCILGPMSCGKSSFLQAIRNGGAECEPGGFIRMHRRDGSLVSSRQLPRTVGFVSQEDILDRSLTVREALLFNARSRVEELYNDLGKANAVVNRVMVDLGLRHVADTVIGGGPNSAANISGGQVKRVNIGCELVALNTPGVLLLDEPTSGLDATIALELVNTLKVVASRGCTVLMVLQQPRSEIFDDLDHLFLMQRNGKIVFDGPPKAAANYLSTVAGYTQHLDTSDADFCIDVLNDIVKKAAPTSSAPTPMKKSSSRVCFAQFSSCMAASAVICPSPDEIVHRKGEEIVKHEATEANAGAAASEAEESKEARISPCPPVTAVYEENGDTSKSSRSNSHGDDATADLGVLWEKSSHRAAVLARYCTLSGEELETRRQRGESLLTGANNDVVRKPWYGDREDWKRFFQLAYLNSGRLLLVRFRDQKSLVIYTMIHVIMAAALSSGFSVFIQGGSYANTFVPPVSATLAEYFPGPLFNIVGRNVNDFALQQLLFFISSSLGCSSALAAVPVFSGLNALIKRETGSGASPFALATGRIVGDMVFVCFNAMIFCGVWGLFGHSGEWYDWIIVILATAFAASGVGYVMGVISTPTNASVYAIISVFIFSVFSGVEPTLKQVNRLPVINFLWYISFSTWSAEATYATWSRYLQEDAVPNRVQEGADGYGFVVTNYTRAVLAMIAIGIAWRVAAIVIVWRQSKK